MKKIEIYNELSETEKKDILNVAYDMVCRKLKDMFIYDYDLQVIKDNYIVLAMEHIERKTEQRRV